VHQQDLEGVAVQKIGRVQQAGRQLPSDLLGRADPAKVSVKLVKGWHSQNGAVERPVDSTRA
jgi:hypothetical protein